MARGKDGFAFFAFSLGYLIGRDSVPGRTTIWDDFEKAGKKAPFDLSQGGTGLGTPEDLRKAFRSFEEAGADQVILLQQSGRTSHEHICESLELFAAEVMPEFKERSDAREAKKQEELAPYIEAALERKDKLPEMKDEDIPVVRSIFKR